MSSDKGTSRGRIRKLIEEDSDMVLSELLNSHFWLNALKVGEYYHRCSDDTDGGYSSIGVRFSPDGDGWIDVVSDVDPDTSSRNFTHRYRTGFGGGQSLRLRNALLVLARAIQLDNEELPQSNAKQD